MTGILIAGDDFSFAADPPAHSRTAATQIGLTAAALAAVVAAGWLAARRGDPRQLLPLAALAMLGIAVGWTRQNAATALPPHHVARLLPPADSTDPASDAILTRLAGRVLTVPASAPASRLNPFLPYEPRPRTRFLLAATELRVADTAPPTAPPPRPSPLTGVVRVVVETGQLDLHPGQAVVLTGRLYRPRGARNPGEPDWAQLGRLQGVHVGLFLPHATLIAREPRRDWPGGRLLGQLRTRARQALFEPFAPVADADQSQRLLDAIVLGTRSAVTSELNEAFMRTGAIHILSVSGFHVAALAGVVWWVFRRWSRRTAATVTIVVLVGYALLAETNAPIVRATLMGLFLCAAQWLRRSAASLNALAAAALLILLFQPLELYRAGFQLSFGQVLALIVVVPRVRGWFRAEQPPEESRDADSWRAFWLRAVTRTASHALLLSVLLWLISAPLVAWHFEMFAPWSALQSLLIAPLAALLVVLGFVQLLVGWLPGLGWLLGILLYALTQTLLAVVHLLAAVPWTRLDVPPPPGWLVALTYAAIATWLLRGEGHADEPVRDAAPRPRRWPARVVGVAAACGVWLAVLLWPRDPGDGTLQVHTFDVGHGSATLVIGPQGETWLADLGTLQNFDAGRTVGQSLRSLGVGRLGALSISHANLDHFSGVPALLATTTSERLVVNPFLDGRQGPHVAAFLAALPAGLPRVSAAAGEVLSGGGLRVDVLHPPPDAGAWSANDQSLVLRFEAFGRRVLVTGDVESVALQHLLAADAAGRLDLSADVLIAPHHGAVLGETGRFLEEVGPEVIVISAGRARAEFAALARGVLGEAVPVLNTHAEGAVAIRLRRGGGLELGPP